MNTKRSNTYYHHNLDLDLNPILDLFPDSPLFGGGYRSRTDDPPDQGRDATAPISYQFNINSLKELFLIPSPSLVEDIGVEPMTLCVQGRCSSQLS